MALRTGAIQVPVGGGVDRSVHEFNLSPPKSFDALNVKTDVGTAYIKRDGFSSIGSAATGDGSIVVTKDESILVTGPEGQAQWQRIPQVPITSNSNYLVPTQVLRHDIFPVRGVVTEPNVAHNGGYTAVVASIAEDPSTAGTTADGQNTIEAICAIVDDGWRIVWGPHRVDEIALMPRVEPVTDGSNVGFVFLGLSDEDESDTDPGLNGAPLNLYAFPVWTSTFAAPSPTLLQVVENPTVGTTETLNKINIYDTHADSRENRVFITTFTVTTAVLEVRMTLWTLAGGLVTNNSQAIAGTGTTVSAHAVWYQQPLATFVVYSRETTKFHYGPEANTSISATGNFTTAGFPIFYLDDVGVLYMADRRVSFSGTTPTPQAADNIIRTVHRRPAPTIAGTLYSNEWVKYVNLYGLASGEQDLRIRTPGNPSLEIGVTPLNASRRPSFYAVHRHITNGDGMMPGQTAVTATGAVLVPQAIVLPNTFAELSEAAFANADADGAWVSPWGVLNGEQWVSVNEVILDSGQRSAIDSFGTAIIAGGQLTSWDGNFVMPAWVDPEDFNYITTNPGDVAATPPTDDGPAGPNAAFLGITTAAHFVRGKAYVLVYTDRNGVQSRSAPTYFGNFQTDEASPVTIWAGEWIELGLSPFNKNLQENGLGLELEGYVASEFAFGGTNPEDYVLKFRAPVVKVNNGYWVWAVASDSFWSVDTPLYSLVDLEDIRPPASNVIARAGNYAFLLPTEAPFEVWASKPIAAYRVPEWNPLLVFHAPPESGGVVSLAGVGDRLYMLCKNGAWELFCGSGPDSTGAGSFPAPRKLYAGDGCVSHNTTVSGPWGVFYVSRSGPKIISDSGQLTDIGDAVFTLVDLDNLTGAVYQDLAREVWLFHSDASGSLVFDLSTATWTRTAVAADQVAIRQGLILKFDATTGLLLQQDDTTTQDGTALTLAKIISPWITTGNLLGFKRCRWLGLPLQYLSGTNGTLRVSLAYDFVDTERQTLDFDWTAILALDKRILEIKPQYQKFSAIRITIQDIAENIGSVENPDLRHDVRWALPSYDLDLGVKKGLNKIEAGGKS